MAPKRYLLPFWFKLNIGGTILELSEAKKKVEAMQQDVARFGRSL
ncbi:hypothetical protein HMPREF0549_0727 [Limosilactobacillus vaginalis DSM 5837 = ATCC 49540]|uniref:Uncharacterized protein n=1 Tax=Limosilactobacillus vaginalis DSM 5837 = ATCC 49540 TaxID=1423814 RepID=C2ETE1_9LACO|nr:hypothetical protein HMPREF0549_0727 [Limosilactobacillus vaginalis DSM 5837 = ATCC 49540]